MLTNLNFIKHFPVLTIINAFEDVANNAIKSAAEAASTVGEEEGGIELG